jgi:MFS family permease
VAPAIIKAWHIERSALAPVFAAGLIGLMLGALTFGPVADRVGRKPVLVFCTLFFGLGSLLTATVESLNGLLLLRFITGLGLGGVLPNAIALTTEYAPARIRATTIMIMFCGFSLGAALGGLAAAGLIASFGWQAVFIVGGVGPCVLFVFLLTLAGLRWLPGQRSLSLAPLPEAQRQQQSMLPALSRCGNRLDRPVLLRFMSYFVARTSARPKQERWNPSRRRVEASNRCRFARAATGDQQGDGE